MDSCFAAGTPIETPRGPLPIEQLRVGHSVYSYDAERTGIRVQPVTAVHRHGARRLGLLRVHTSGELRPNRTVVPELSAVSVVNEFHECCCSGPTNSGHRVRTSQALASGGLSAHAGRPRPHPHRLAPRLPHGFAPAI